MMARVIDEPRCAECMPSLCVRVQCGLILENDIIVSGHGVIAAAILGI